jgi:hypothetical protein
MLVREMQEGVQDNPEIARGLAQITKLCVLCRKYTDQALIFKCDCSICVPCLKGKLLGRSERLLSNPYEAVKRQEALCGCPNHGDAINLPILTKLFGSQRLIESSVAALRRQLKHGTMSSEIRSAHGEGTMAQRLCLLQRTISR